MFDANMWCRQMNYADMLKSCAAYNCNIKSLSRQEYNEFMDLKRRHEEQLIYEVPDTKPVRKTGVPSKNYA